MSRLRSPGVTLFRDIGARLRGKPPKIRLVMRGVFPPEKARTFRPEIECVEDLVNFALEKLEFVRYR
jgi:hypothetical protein